MRRLALVFLILVAFALPLMADPAPVFETITVANSSIGITSTTYSPDGQPQKTVCILTLETAQIRYRFDGQAPTSSVGHIMDTGGVLVITDHAMMASIRFIRTGGSSGALSVTCS